MLHITKNLSMLKPMHNRKESTNVFTETTKLIREFKTNRLVQDFIHDVNKRLSNKRFYSRMDKPYYIDDTHYTQEEIVDFVYVFMGKFPFQLYKPYNVFPIEKGYFKLDLQFGDCEQLLTVKTKDKTIPKNFNFKKGNVNYEF